MMRDASDRPASRTDETGRLWMSGRSATPDLRYFHADPRETMGAAEQVRMAFAAIELELAARGRSLSDVASVTEYVPIGSLRDYGEIAAARDLAIGGRSVPVRTKIVHRLLHASARIEFDVSAGPGATAANRDHSAWHRSVVSTNDDLVTLPTLLPIDEQNRIIAAGDIVGQYRYCLERADQLLGQLGLSLGNVVRTLDYSTPLTAELYPHDLRREMLGPVYPCAFSILNDAMHVPGVLVSLDIVASRLPGRVVNPGWSRYDGLSYSPAVQVGRRLFMSGTVALDQVKAWPMYYGDPVRQAELTYRNIAAMLAAAGAGPGALVKLNEYLVPEAVPFYPQISAARQAFLGAATPAITSVVCSQMLWPVFLFEAIPTAILDQ